MDRDSLLVDLALRGAVHMERSPGAFTWGAFDRLLSWNFALWGCFEIRRRHNP